MSLTSGPGSGCRSLKKNRVGPEDPDPNLGSGSAIPVFILLLFQRSFYEVLTDKFLASFEVSFCAGSGCVAELTAHTVL
jgi:hypothetical protein